MEPTFRTIVPIKPREPQIVHGQEILMLGSCFTDEMGRRLERDGFRVTHNPAGPLFNPASICSLLSRALDHRTFRKEEFFCRDGLWVSTALHSSLAAPSLDVAVERADRMLEELAGRLTRVSHLILTFGTPYTWVGPDGEVVANCQKLPESYFTRHTLGVDEIVDMTSAIIGRIGAPNVIVTVSPVRHKPDFHANAVGKGILLQAADRLVEAGLAQYFPAFEILTDELRDYRFYATDMLHPSEQAADYIYSRFAAERFSADTRELARRFGALRSRAEHRFADPQSASAQSFAADTLRMAQELAYAHPLLEPEIHKFLTPQ